MNAKRNSSKRHLLMLANELVETYGERLTLLVFQRETGVSQRVIYELFGSWRSLRVELGLKGDAPRNSNGITRDEILKRAREMAAAHGERLTRSQFLRETGYSGRMIEIRFGSWGSLREMVGLSSRAKLQRQYTDDEILLDLYRVYRVFRERPIYDKHSLRGGRISTGTICHRMGSWDWACRRLGDLLKGEGHYNSKMPLPEVLEEKVRLERKKEGLRD